jgi:hypothetical protein
MIESASRIGGPAGPIAVLVAVALLAGSASAATSPVAGRASTAKSNSVSISGPRRVAAGAKVKLRFTGYAAGDVHGLRIWLDNRKCATTAKAEGARPELRTPSNFAVSGPFKARLTVMRSSMGTHVVCAYLLHRGTQNTAARASWRYVTR